MCDPMDLCCAEICYRLIFVCVYVCVPSIIKQKGNMHTNVLYLYGFMKIIYRNILILIFICEIAMIIHSC